ncbi:hypothetical protein AHAS_Ahas16G0177600 [Arachis hypogaea]
MKKKKGLLLFNNFGNGSGIALFHVTQNPFGFFQPILTKLETKKMTNSFLSGSRDFKCKNKNVYKFFKRKSKIELIDHQNFFIYK